VRAAFDIAGEAAVTVHDVQGRLMADLHRGPVAAGERIFRWSGAGGGGRTAPAGVYFLRIRSAGAVAVARLVLEN
jgi:hypothetical protein